MMKMVKGLLLGSAAGFVAVAGAQAADLPVKARPVEYVKVCSLYGAGFYYMPGTDTCIKIGGYVRSQYDWNAAGDGKVYFQPGVGDETRSDTDPAAFRHRFVLSADVRTQTEYGTLRAYATTGAQQTTPGAATFFFNRAFIQFAGFTTGRAVSFYDFLSLDPYSYNNTALVSSTGAAGINVFAYTAQLGNGVSATLSAEDGGYQAKGGSGRGRLVVDLTNNNGFGAGQALTSDPAGNRFPDIVGSLRVDQAWGSAQVMAAAHDVTGAYFGTPDSTLSGHPGDEVGWAGGAGLLLRSPVGLGVSDVFQSQFNFTRGAVGYVTTFTGPWLHYGSGNSVGWGQVADGIFDTGTGIELTQGWGFAAAYEHHWNPNWKTSIYGGFTSISYNDTATALICAAPTVLRGPALGTSVSN